MRAGIRLCPSSRSDIDIDAFVRDTVMKARVVGLRARPELNNTTVTTLTFVLDRGRFAVETSTSERVLLKPCALDFGFPLVAYETADVKTLCEGARLHAKKGAAAAAFFIAQLHLELRVEVEDTSREQAVQGQVVHVVMACLRAYPQNVDVVSRGLAVVTELLEVPEARAQVEEAADTLEMTAKMMRGTRDYVSLHNAIHLLVELYYRDGRFALSATGRNSFTQRAVGAGLLGTVVDTMRTHRKDEAIQTVATRLLTCFNPRAGPQLWREARDCGFITHLVYLASAFAPTEADSVMAIEPLEVTGADPNSPVHKLVLAMLGAWTSLSDPEHITAPYMDAAEAERAHEQMAAEGSAEVTAQLREQAQYAAMRFNCTFAGGSGSPLSTESILQSFDEWNRRLEREDPGALLYLLAGVPPIAEWAAEGVDVRGGCQQLAGTVAVAILGMDRAEP